MHTDPSLTIMEQQFNYQQTDVTILQGRLREMSKHMRFVGMFFIVYGAIACITIIGALLGIPYIIAGLRLRESADSYSGYARNSDARQLLVAFEKQSSFFFIMKVLLIIALVLMALYFLFILGMIFFFGTGFFEALDSF